MRSHNNQITRREFARLLAGAGLALSLPRALAASASGGPIVFKNAAPACGSGFRFAQ